MLCVGHHQYSCGCVRQQGERAKKPGHVTQGVNRSSVLKNADILYKRCRSRRSSKSKVLLTYCAISSICKITYRIGWGDQCHIQSVISRYESCQDVCMYVFIRNPKASWQAGRKLRKFPRFSHEYYRHWQYLIWKTDYLGWTWHLHRLRGDVPNNTGEKYHTSTKPREASSRKALAHAMQDHAVEGYRRCSHCCIGVSLLYFSKPGLGYNAPYNYINNKC